ncbi:L-proline dehydrogenase /delta-1-pyrroline-5-carboxylate dehydrogenase [Rhodothalassium salexigens DSM 2132]|uniref:Bifunctional protein PutA n=1 Tax=Rhodothalassium salexigens DSM 2132 TaxID=1188247 RepID=A0A4R2PE63_RHOSA|nr:bifunctional proline dehydrogenase/L-glutamate gamma-semialdehyde dehydrogenase PutA [Rhodothalassium salexigens]MBB4211875.1 RHH-type proline utilization regulon transcriptional repressor/proline dehydrogenase/delta 1-pyrroline-5-carboxylate dehydrogenase [Rhodothalassium salexigens DSM 2132]MBK1638916.1 bifunctional proline dehydrogenase/L-glutamate gamma-semialdehyde dehydrogenase [Rhodothalassium salexigens DSM 2132]TCP33540.1 L-proline dehydrogenase /delta-1-pyrroline-5-carboxylate dehyd
MCASPTVSRPGAPHVGTTGTRDALARHRAAIRAAKHEDEPQAVARLRATLDLDARHRAEAVDLAQQIVSRSRDKKTEQGTIDAFLQEFGLSNQEGIALMCLAEALLRVPDRETQDDLISEKIRSGDWDSHLGQSDSPFVNAGVWALMLTGRIAALDEQIVRHPGHWLEKLIHRSGEPVIRQAINQAMKIMGRQFVYGRSIDDAIARRARQPAGKQLVSFDMLGEGARTDAAAQTYFDAYAGAIDAVGGACRDEAGGPTRSSSLSVKLSALHARFEQTQEDRVIAELLPRARALALCAKAQGIQMTIDAEEADRLDLSLTVIEALARDPELAGWDGLGLAIQAYQKRALPLIHWVAALARETHRQIPVRLVKGAYWDTEIKHTQVMGLDDYPVFTRKPNTDVNYLACAKAMIGHGDALFPQFASHNAHTIALVSSLAGDAPHEFQRLHGMGELLYKAAEEVLGRPITTRIYAPVGQHSDLLPYLVRRLLENGANSSFVNRFMDASVPVEEVTFDPLDDVDAHPLGRHANIPLPLDLFGPERRNSQGVDLAEPTVTGPLLETLASRARIERHAACLVDGAETGAAPAPVHRPADARVAAGTMRAARPADIEAALASAVAAQPAWDARGGGERAAILRAMADALEAHRTPLLDLMTRDAGKTIADGIAEVREAADFCRYYAVEAERHCAVEGTPLPGPTGEANRLSLHGRGVFLCISPWNFPLAIFTGQIAAALAAGNAVIAKPAEQTPLVAHYAADLFLRAGVPGAVLHLLLGDGPTVAGPILRDRRLAGVAFTGSVPTAKLIQRTLAERDGAILPLIAETGGQNAMVVDSTALHEQVADDALMSAFGSAGQRCSALRVMLVQDSVAEPMIEMLKGALAERRVGDPARLSTDIGPIIDAEALARLDAHAARMDREAHLVARAELPESCAHGTYFAPRIYEIDRLSQLTEEVFGPVMHVLRFRGEDIEALLSELRDTGYGLTFGVHTRLEGRWETLFRKTLAGNMYVNRNMVGAVVGSQPFGGTGLSGTGPKAGGPYYLPRFANERVMTVNTAAIGGNTDLFQLSEET